MDDREIRVGLTIATTITILCVGFIVFLFTTQVKNRAKEVA